MRMPFYLLALLGLAGCVAETAGHDDDDNHNYA